VCPSCLPIRRYCPSCLPIQAPEEGTLTTPAVAAFPTRPKRKSRKTSNTRNTERLKDSDTSSGKVGKSFPTPPRQERRKRKSRKPLTPTKQKVGQTPPTRKAGKSFPTPPPARVSQIPDTPRGGSVSDRPQRKSSISGNLQHPLSRKSERHLPRKCRKELYNTPPARPSLTGYPPTPARPEISRTTSGRAP